MFLAKDGRRLDRHGAGRIVRKTARRAGIDKLITLRTLRHAFITASFDAGVPVLDVQEAASHADPRTTMRYGGPAAAWTGTLPTSSPPTSRVPPGNPHRLALLPGRLRPQPPGGQAQRRPPARRRGGDGPQPHSEREPSSLPICMTAVVQGSKLVPHAKGHSVRHYRRWARRDYLARWILTDLSCAKATGRLRPAAWYGTVGVTGSSQRFWSPGQQAWSAGSGPRGRVRSGWLAPTSMRWQAASRRTARWRAGPPLPAPGLVSSLGFSGRTHRSRNRWRMPGG